MITRRRARRRHSSVTHWLRLGRFVACSDVPTTSRVVRVLARLGEGDADAGTDRQVRVVDAREWPGARVSSPRRRGRRERAREVGHVARGGPTHMPAPMPGVESRERVSWCHYSALRVTRARFLVTAVTQIRDRLRRACDGSQNLMRALRPERRPRLILFVLTNIITGQKDFMESTFGAGVRCGYRESMRAHCSRVSRVATRHPMAALGATLVVTHADLRYEVVK